MGGATWNPTFFVASFTLGTVKYFDMLLVLFIEFYGSKRILVEFTLYFVVGYPVVVS